MMRGVVFAQFGTTTSRKSTQPTAPFVRRNADCVSRNILPSEKRSCGAGTGCD